MESTPQFDTKDNQTISKVCTTSRVIKLTYILECLPVGVLDGFLVGSLVGFVEGLVVGWLVGFMDGSFVGIFVGFPVGIIVGFAVGLLLGATQQTLKSDHVSFPTITRNFKK